MAKKRMFSLQIVDTDAFLDMPLSAQALYFHLNMRADDEGFVSNHKNIMRLIGSQEDNLKILTAKRFILSLENGIVVIKHWLVHNNIRTDRIIKTAYIKEKKALRLKENNSYTEKCQTNVRQVTDKCPHSIDKTRLDKSSITSAKSRRSIKFSSKDYKEIISIYEDLKGIKFSGTEYSPIQQTIKSMFMDKREKKDIIALMKTLNSSSFEHWQGWTIQTVKKQIPLFLSGKLKF